MAQRDLIISFLSSVTPTTMMQFARKPLTLQSPVTQHGAGKFPGGRAGYQMWVQQYADGQGNVIPGMFKAAGAQPGDTIGRVCVMGFSNGCIGVDEVLRRRDSAKIDVVIACDGIHGAYRGGTSELNLASYKRWMNHAASVLQPDPDAPAAPVMAIAHSSIVPPGFPSTTETANLIWSQAMTMAPRPYKTQFLPGAPAVYLDQLLADDWPDGKEICATNRKKCFRWESFADGLYDQRAVNGLYVLGWGHRENGSIVTRDPTGNADHIFLGRAVLPKLVQTFAASRWNAECGLVATAGLGQDTSCAPGKGRVYSESDAGKIDFFPEIQPGGSAAMAPPRCPEPPPGNVVVGSAEDPCATAAAPSPPSLSFEPRPLLEKALWLGVSAAAGYGAVRWIASRS